MASTARIISLLWVASCLFVLTAGISSRDADESIVFGAAEDAAVSGRLRLGPAPGPVPMMIEGSTSAKRHDSGAVMNLIRMGNQPLSLESLKKMVAIRSSRKKRIARRKRKERMERKQRQARKRKRARRRRARDMAEAQMSPDAQPSPVVDMGEPDLLPSPTPDDGMGDLIPPVLPTPFEVFPDESMMPLPEVTDEPVNTEPPVIMVKEMSLQLARGGRSNANYRVYVLQGTVVRHYRINFNFQQPARPPGMEPFQQGPTLRERIQSCIERKFNRWCLNRKEKKKAKCSDRVVKRCVENAGTVTFFKETKANPKVFKQAPVDEVIPSIEVDPTDADSKSMK